MYQPFWAPFGAHFARALGKVPHLPHPLAGPAFTAKLTNSLNNSPSAKKRRFAIRLSLYRLSDVRQSNLPKNGRLVTKTDSVDTRHKPKTCFYSTVIRIF